MSERNAKVRVKSAFRVVHDGKAYTDGDEVTVPETTAALWDR
jgi:hypothetical protein